MGSLRVDIPEEIEAPSGIKLSAGKVADFIGGLTGDRFDDERPTLSEFFSEKGVDAGLAYHDNRAKLYVEASPWAMNNTQNPEDGARGIMSERNGNLSFGALLDSDGQNPAGYVQGEYSVRFGEAGWTPPESYTFKNDPILDENGDVLVEGSTNVYEYDGYHAYDGPVTELSVLGYADTQGGLHIEGRAEHERSLSISGHDFDLSAQGAAGYNDESGLFAKASGEMSTILHEPSGTYGYARGEITVAQSDDFNQHNVQMGVGSNFSGTLPLPVEIGADYNGQELRPSVGMGIRF